MSAAKKKSDSILAYTLFLVSQIAVKQVTDPVVLQNKMIKADHMVKAFDTTTKFLQRTNLQVQAQRARMAIGPVWEKVFGNLTKNFQSRKAPNYIHSIDAAHAQLTAVRMCGLGKSWFNLRAGLTD